MKTQSWISDRLPEHEGNYRVIFKNGHTGRANFINDPDYIKNFWNKIIESYLDIDKNKF